ncbi:ankyrin-3 [Aplysia californica]|uniref:Ankyrin-3 n=1 Tax=Aplysia californica TaxID=6500 RepID=A0ABM1AC13_APLCA|nr:ankyrin-3 [Aplysia californica]
MTALHLAAKHGHIDVMNGLKEFIPFRTASEKTGLTALHVAAHYGKADFVREMLTIVSACVKSESPISSTYGSQWSSEAGMTPLHFAAQSGHEGLVRILLNCPGVQTDAPTSVTVLMSCSHPSSVMSPLSSLAFIFATRSIIAFTGA